MPKLENYRIDKFSQMAFYKLPKELLWKVYVEIAMVAERKGQVALCKTFLYKAVHVSPANLKWKPIIFGSRLELKMGDERKSLKILNTCLRVLPEKHHSMIFLELSRYYEFVGDIAKCLDLMEKAKELMKSEWKVCP